MYPPNELWALLHSVWRDRGVIPLSKEDHRPRLLAWASVIVVANVMAGTSVFNFNGRSGELTDGKFRNHLIGTNAYGKGDKSDLGNSGLAQGRRAARRTWVAVLTHLRTEITAVGNAVAFARVVIDPGRSWGSGRSARVGLTC